MTPMGQFPEWVNMGDGPDYVTSTGTLVDALRKRMKQKPQGGVGEMADGALNESPSYSQLLGGSVSSPSSAKGIKSL